MVLSTVDDPIKWHLAHRTNGHLQHLGSLTVQNGRLLRMDHYGPSPYFPVQ